MCSTQSDKMWHKTLDSWHIQDSLVLQEVVLSRLKFINSFWFAVRLKYTLHARFKALGYTMCFDWTTADCLWEKASGELEIVATGLADTPHTAMEKCITSRGCISQSVPATLLTTALAQLTSVSTTSQNKSLLIVFIWYLTVSSIKNANNFPLKPILI